MSSEDSQAFDASNKPKFDKFAALAAAQQQKATDPQIADVNSAGEDATNAVDMLIEDESSQYDMETIPEHAIQAQPSESMTSQQPPRRDKFASMAAAAAAVVVVETSSTPDNDGNESNRTTTQRTPTNDKFAAVQKQKQADDQNKQRQCLMELCSQRDSIWNDCDMAEHAVTDLLKYAEQTAMLLSKNTTVSSIDSDAYIKSKEELSTLLHDYQSSVVQVHDLLSKHAHHVQAYQSNVQRHGETIFSGNSSSSTSNSMYTQRVEHRLAETKRLLIQDLLTLMKEEDDLPNVST